MSAPLIFSDSWHLISGQKFSLRPEIRIRRQTYRGRLWYVLGDPYAHRFFRVSPETYRLLERLEGKSTVESAWLDVVSSFPDEAPGQQEVLRVLNQLFQAGLLRAETPLESERLFRLMSRERSRAVQMRWLQFLFMRIPLWDPDRLLNRGRRLVDWGIGLPGAILWSAVVLVGALQVLGRSELLVSEGEGVLAPNNIGWLYLTWVFVKFFHELGHAAVCKRYGGEVHVMGVMLLVFTPFPYMDASSAWAFRERWKRVLTGAAGMVFEVFLAGIAAVIWARTSPGLAHQLAYNVMFLASVSTVLFNINPLLRFDGYYILSDLLDSPNLHQRSGRQLLHCVERYLFGLKDSESVALSRREAFWLPTFAVGSGVYRILVLGVILLFLAERFLGIGLVLAAVGLILWLVVPLGRALVYLFSEPRLGRRRSRALLVALSSLGLLFVFLFGVPFPHHFRSPGVVRSPVAREVISEVEGRIASVHVESGQRVSRGDLLIRLINPDLLYEVQRVEAALDEVEARRSLAMEKAPAYIAPLDARKAALEERLLRLKDDVAALDIRAPVDGMWSAPILWQAEGLITPRGTRLGVVVPEKAFRFVAVTSQEDASNLLGGRMLGSEMRLYGQAEYDLRGSDIRIAPAEFRELPTPSLGWKGGGSVQVRANDDSGTETIEPWFEVSFALPDSEWVDLCHLRSGVARFDLEPEPLGTQWVRRLRQLLQRRLGI